MASIWDDIVAAVASKEVPLESAVDQIEMMGFPRGTATKIATGELPMDAASREARRVEQNFIDPVYHSGNLEGITEIDPRRVMWASDNPAVTAGYGRSGADTYPGTGNAGYRLYVNPENYASYNAEGAMWENLEMPLNDIVMPDGTKVPITRVNPDDPTYTSTDDVAQFVTGQRGANESIDMDYASGVKIKNVDDPGGNYEASRLVAESMGLGGDEITDLTEGYGMTNYGIVSPESVRLEGAAFDPENVGKPYLMGAVGNESPGVLDRATSLGGTAADLATQTWDNMSLLDKAALVTSPLPIVGTATGVAADVMNMVNNPEERTLLNTALLASNFIPGKKMAEVGSMIVDASGNAVKKITDTFKNVPEADLGVVNDSFDQVDSRINQLKMKDESLKSPSQRRDERYTTPQNLSEEELKEYNELSDRRYRASIAGKTGEPTSSILQILRGE